MIKTFPDERRVIEFIAGDDPSRTRTIISAVELTIFEKMGLRTKMVLGNKPVGFAEDVR